MKIFAVLIGLIWIQFASAAPEAECLAGNFKSCKKVFDYYGSTSKDGGRFDFFAKVCASENLRVDCQVLSVEDSELTQKLLEVASSDTGVFAVGGKKLAKLYIVKPADQK